MSMTSTTNSKTSQRLARYRTMAELARREAGRTAGDARESYLFLADQWERLAEMAERKGAGPKTSFG